MTSLTAVLLPPAARAVSGAVRDATAAALATNRESFDDATARLAGLDPALVRVALGSVVRSLLEERHPDGLELHDVQQLLETCLESALAWLPDVDTAALTVVVTGALGVHEPDEVERPVTPAGVATAAPLLVAALLDGAPRGLEKHLEDAFAEIARQQTVEMP